MLALSTKYALKALLHLAQKPKDQFIQVQSLSEEAKVPGPYLSKIIKQLAACGLVDTRRGICGGVRLPHRTKTLTFYDVCMAMDDPVVSQSCFLTKSACSSTSPCVMHAHWTRMKREMVNFLQGSKIEK